MKLTNIAPFALGGLAIVAISAVVFSIFASGGDPAVIGTAIPSLLIGIGSTTTAYIAQRSFASQREQASKNTAVELVGQMVSDPELSGIFERFRLLRKQLEALDQSTITINMIKQSVVQNNGNIFLGDDIIKRVYNFYEFVASAINLGSLDEGIYKDWWRESFVKDWITFRGYITEARKNQNASELFQRLESKALEWANEEELEFLNSENPPPHTII